MISECCWAVILVVSVLLSSSCSMAFQAPVPLHRPPLIHFNGYSGSSRLLTLTGARSACCSSAGIRSHRSARHRTRIFTHVRSHDGRPHEVSSFF